MFGRNNFRYTDGFVAKLRTLYPTEAEFLRQVDSADTMSVELFLEAKGRKDLLKEAKEEWRNRSKQVTSFGV